MIPDVLQYLELIDVVVNNDDDDDDYNYTKYNM